jgi:hypothetical protein
MCTPSLREIHLGHRINENPRASRGGVQIPSVTVSFMTLSFVLAHAQRRGRAQHEQPPEVAVA